MLLHDKEIMKDGKYEEYRKVLDDQTANYKDYMASFLKEDGQYDELIRDSSFYRDKEYLDKIFGKILIYIYQSLLTYKLNFMVKY
jgi:hypothetical protein